jgi:hypothetical protein
MINYIQHDKEFYGVVKLSQGEEILGELLVTDDAESPGTSIVFITYPARSKAVEVEKTGQVGIAVGLLKWQYFSEEHFYIIPEKDILCISPMSPTGISVYKKWLKSEEGIDDKSEEHPFYREVNENMGSLGSVKNAKSFLENLFNAPSSDKS